MQIETNKLVAHKIYVEVWNCRNLKGAKWIPIEHKNCVGVNKALKRAKQVFLGDSEWSGKTVVSVVMPLDGMLWKLDAIDENISSWVAVSSLSESL